MTESEVQRAIMRICKVDGHDSDFNVVGFYALCDRLKQIGIAEEREAVIAQAIEQGFVSESYAKQFRAAIARAEGKV